MFCKTAHMKAIYNGIFKRMARGYVLFPVVGIFWKYIAKLFLFPAICVHPQYASGIGVGYLCRTCIITITVGCFGNVFYNDAVQPSVSAAVRHRNAHQFLFPCVNFYLNILCRSFCLKYKLKRLVDCRNTFWIKISFSHSCLPFP